jgi:peptidoglycan/xylan/chitin deacetylase (PgdA/CDA1 family)
MIMGGLGWFQQAGRRIRGLVQPRAIILVYHRIADLPSDPWSLAVTPSHFGEHLEVLRRSVRLIGLQELASALRKGTLPRRSAVMTFDDGYADNLHHGKPLLQRCDTPATVFVTTGYIGSEQEFWWDELERIFLQPGSLPRQLSLTIAGCTNTWDLGEARSYSEDTALRHRSWKTTEPPPTARHSVYLSLWKQLRTSSANDRHRALQQIRSWGSVEPTGRSTHRTLTREEVLTLAQGDLMEIGAHTVTHPSLAGLSTDSQRDEVEQSKAFLETLLGRRVASFAYPFGGRGDYTGETESLVRAAGFSSACSTAPGVVGPSTGRYQLPRIYVRDCDGKEFAKLSSRWLLT